MTIKYVAYTWLGERVEGVLDADSEDAAYEALEQDQLIPYQLQPVRAKRSLVQRMPALFRPKAQDLINFSRQLASLLKSGVPLRRALAVLREENRSRGLREALRQIVEEIEAGSRFSDACARHPTVFPTFYIRLLKVGEATGGLTLTLRQLTDTLERSKSARDKVRRALTYPAISLAVAIVAAVVLVAFALPALIGLLEEFDSELPLATQLLKSAAEFMRSYVAFLGGVSGALVLLTWAYVRTVRGRRMRDHLLLRLPVVGRVLMRTNMFTLTSTLKTLLEAGVPPIEALRLSKESLGNVVIREAVENVIRETEAGNRLGQAFKEQGMFPPLLYQGIITGEVTGTLGDTLRGLAEFYEQETEQAVSGATELIQPAVTLVVAFFVGFVAVAITQGIYSTIGSVVA